MAFTNTQIKEFQADLTDPRHGSPNGYRNLKCRCPKCKLGVTKIPSNMKLRHDAELAEVKARHKEEIQAWRDEFDELRDALRSLRSL